MKKKIEQERWVLLPTNDIEHVIIEKNTGLLLLQTKDKEFSGAKNNLYLTSDDEIKGGKEVYYIDKFTNKVTSSGGAEYGENQNVIIATTDSSLKLYEAETLASAPGFSLKTNDILLPQIPESFIKYYVEKQGEVGDVELGDNPCKQDPILCMNLCDCGLKLTDNNEIIIDIPVERGITITKTYTQEELVSKIREAIYNTNQWDGITVTYYPDGSVNNIEQESLDKWIKENL